MNPQLKNQIETHTRKNYFWEFAPEMRENIYKIGHHKHLVEILGIRTPDKPRDKLLLVSRMTWLDKFFYNYLTQKEKKQILKLNKIKGYSNCGHLELNKLYLSF